MSLDALFARVEEEMPGFLSVAVGSLVDGGPFASHHIGELDLGEAPDALRRTLRGYAQLYAELGGPVELGSHDEVLVTASRTYLLARVDHEAQRFLAVLLSSSGNIGYLRFKMRHYLRDPGVRALR